MSMLRSVLPTRPVDPDTSDDPAVIGVLAALRALDYGIAPRPEFRDDLRRQLVAVAARVVAEGEPAVAAPATALGAALTTAPGTASVTTGRSLNREVRRPRLARPMTVAASVVVLLGLLLTGAVAWSRNALPGDALYGLKRADEDVRLSLTSGDTDRGRDYLSLAQTRVQEAQQLTGSPSALGAGPQASTLSPQLASRIRATLADADTDLRAGAALLGQQAVSSGSPASLAVMRSWAPGQLTRLRALAAALPAGATRADATAAWTLTDQALARATSLQRHVGTSCLETSGVDSLGPLPCGAAGGPATSDAPGRGSTTPGSAHSTAAPAPVGTGSRTGADRNGTGHRDTGRSNTGRASRTGGIGGTGVLGTSIPSLPVQLPTDQPTTVTVPASAGSCGASASAAGVSVGVTTCPTSH